MIAYFDTSSVIPLIIDEPGSATCTRIWNEATRVVSSRLVNVEARAALAQAMRLGRLTAAQLVASTNELDRTIAQIDLVEIREDLARTAGDLAETYALRGYDAVHLASAQFIAEDDVVVVTGDDSLGAAATRTGMLVALTS